MVERVWGDGEMGRWGDGEMGRWGDGEMGRWGVWEKLKNKIYIFTITMQDYQIVSIQVSVISHQLLT
ncbi:hypothetical protein [Okeania sp. SIO2B3]|uniref:hypothetical protein n=1 Tax=Okeania sp. SIO2B3 TaxID=2607784 RepID=UPI0013BEF2BB|nr:hypothetical protein [Okeania sp. SIO2B3]NET44890.1 hypothetical protein [Okeania sp. SIO2B3]